MILIDTSVWVTHLRSTSPSLRQLLQGSVVFTHPFVIGELACGHLQNRLETFSLLRALPQAPVADHEEVFRFIHDRRLMGRGLGWIDMHLLASALLSRSHLWTLDKALRSTAKDLRLSYEPSSAA